MRHNLGLGTGLSSPVTIGGMVANNNSSLPAYGRVMDVVLDKSHPKFKDLGGTQALYGVFFQPLYTDSEEEISNQNFKWRFAYCGSSLIRRIPIKNEIVRLESRMSAASSEEDYSSDGDVSKVYWTDIVPVWNHPHLNAYPDIPNQSKNDYGKDFKENEDIKPLQLNAGDVSIEGRHGQSLRFGGTKSSNSPIAKDESNGKPYTILRNGQASANGDTCFEDVDKDDSSIYLTSDHKVPITEANRKFKAAVKIPGLTKEYKGKQIVMNSDRVVINAREDNLTMAAKKHASINADTTSVDGEQYVGLDAKKVYLGSLAQKEQEPVLKGTMTGQLLLDLGTAMLTWCTQLASSLTSGAAIDPPLAAGGAATSTFIGDVQRILGKARVDSIKSTKVYTE